MKQFDFDQIFLDTFSDKDNIWNDWIRDHYWVLSTSINLKEEELEVNLINWIHGTLDVTN